MNIRLSVESYKGVDGSSLSETRCNQIVSVYEMLMDLNDKVINYIDIQEEAEKRHLFGFTKAKSAIRTFFPLLKKIGFVNYDGVFAANQCFTELGTQFVLANRALQKVSDQTPHHEEIRNKLLRIKRNTQCLGLIKMSQDAEYKDHHMWHALKLLKELRSINWNEFLYALHMLEEGNDMENIIIFIRQNRDKIASYEFQNEKGESLPNTCYSYLRSYLEECNLIKKEGKNDSSISPDFDNFYSQLSLD